MGTWNQLTCGSSSSHLPMFDGHILSCSSSACPPPVSFHTTPHIPVLLPGDTSNNHAQQPLLTSVSGGRFPVHSQRGSGLSMHSPQHLQVGHDSDCPTLDWQSHGTLGKRFGKKGAFQPPLTHKSAFPGAEDASHEGCTSVVVPQLEHYS